MLSLSQLARDARGLDRPTFIARFCEPALVLCVPSGLRADEGHIDTPHPEDDDPAATHLSPQSESPFANLPAPTPTPSDEGAIVYWLKKTGRNPFSTMITIGRARNNDIVIETPTVSKLHAYVTTRPEGYFIHDQGSTNGTTVDGRKLGKNDSAALVDGARIELAPGLLLRFYRPGALFDIVQFRGSPRP
jgi:hypothetical protein